MERDKGNSPEDFFKSTFTMYVKIPDTYFFL